MKSRALKSQNSLNLLECAGRDSFCCIEIIFLIPEVLFEVDSHLSLHDAEAASDNTFVIDLLDLETERRVLSTESICSNLNLPNFQEQLSVVFVASEKVIE